MSEIVSTDPAISYPDEVGVIRTLAGESVILWEDGFEENKDWESAGMGDGEWERGAPQGLGEPNADPQTAYEGEFVLGNDLTGLGDEAPGNYEKDIFMSSFRSPRIPISSGYAVTKITFAHWLNLGTGPTMAKLKVYSHELGFGGKDWTWEEGTTESSWSVDTFDIRDVTVGEDWLRVDFEIHHLGSGETNSGWNIDALEVHGVRTDSCEAFDRALPGEATEFTVDRGAPGELVLSWAADCGHATTYGVYRGDLRVGYDSIVAEPGACNVMGTGATIPLGVGDAEFFLVVPHKDGEEGSYGTDSSGTPRAPAAGGCYPQGAVDLCAP